MEKFWIVTAIIGAVTSLGLIKIVRVFIKEIKEAVEVYKKAKEDGKITEDETKAIAKECMDAIGEGIKLGYAIKKAIGLVKDKKK